MIITPCKITLNIYGAWAVVNLHWHNHVENIYSICPLPMLLNADL